MDQPMKDDEHKENKKNILECSQTSVDILSDRQ
jgi:hypothetical protein